MRPLKSSAESESVMRKSHGRFRLTYVSCVLRFRMRFFDNSMQGLDRRLKQSQQPANDRAPRLCLFQVGTQQAVAAMSRGQERSDHNAGTTRCSPPSSPAVLFTKSTSPCTLSIPCVLMEMAPDMTPTESRHKREQAGASIKGEAKAAYAFVAELSEIQDR